MSSIAVIGLGAMGTPIARSLHKAGHEVTVWNRLPGPARALAAEGLRVTGGIEGAWDSGVVFSMLSHDHAVTETFLSSGLLDVAPAGSVHVNLATVNPELARRAAELHAEHGVGYLARRSSAVSPWRRPQASTSSPPGLPTSSSGSSRSLTPSAPAPGTSASNPSRPTW